MTRALVLLLGVCTTCAAAEWQTATTFPNERADVDGMPFWTSLLDASPPEQWFVAWQPMRLSTEHAVELHAIRAVVGQSGFVPPDAGTLLIEIVNSRSAAEAFNPAGASGDAYWQGLEASYIADIYSIDYWPYGAAFGEPHYEIALTLEPVLLLPGWHWVAVWFNNPFPENGQVGLVEVPPTDGDGPPALNVGPQLVVETAPLAIELTYRENLVGDLNCDGRIDYFDIDPLIEMLSKGLTLDDVLCAPENGDVNLDGRTDYYDIDPFIDLLVRIALNAEGEQAEPGDTGQ